VPVPFFSSHGLKAEKLSSDKEARGHSAFSEMMTRIASVTGQEEKVAFSTRRSCNFQARIADFRGKAAKRDD
jgi:hypothetical protein